MSGTQQWARAKQMPDASSGLGLSIKRPSEHGKFCFFPCDNGWCFNGHLCHSKICGVEGRGFVEQVVDEIDGFRLQRALVLQQCRIKYTFAQINY